jgi:hypothetical protein
VHAARSNDLFEAIKASTQQQITPQSRRLVGPAPHHPVMRPGTWRLLHLLRQALP